MKRVEFFEVGTTVAGQDWRKDAKKKTTAQLEKLSNGAEVVSLQVIEHKEQGYGISIRMMAVFSS